MKDLSVKEILKEIEEYGVSEEDIRKEYEYEKNEGDNTEQFKNVSFDEYVKGYYFSDKYIIKEEMEEI